MDDRLYRSRNDRIFAGVAGGLADRWDADPSLIRLIWALLVILTGGIALLVYVIMAFVVPEEPVAFTSGAGIRAAGEASEATPAGAYQSPYGYVPTRAERRAMRREARRARRAGRDGQAAAAIGGLILIALGSMFLLREWFPRLDFDWFWPMVLIGIGVAVVVGALTRRTEVDGTAPSPWQPAAPDVAASPEAPAADAPHPRPM
jgi:phage shock protein PspC (stress-responsive transcriptional regulator)